MKLYKNYIDGKWLESESKDIIQVDDPATGKVIGEISCAKKNEVALAVSAAKAAFKFSSGFEPLRDAIFSLLTPRVFQLDRARCDQFKRI